MADIWTLVDKPTNTPQDGAYTEVESDGAYAPSGPHEHGIPYGAWTDTGDGWYPVYLPSVPTSWSLVSKPSDVVWDLGRYRFVDDSGGKFVDDDGGQFVDD